MLVIPFEVNAVRTKRGPIVLVLILEKENLDRMREGDPLDLQLRAIPTIRNLFNRPLVEIDLVLAYEEDLNMIMKFRQAQDLPGLLSYIERGRKNLPGDGLPPQLLRKT